MLDHHRIARQPATPANLHQPERRSLLPLAARLARSQTGRSGALPGLNRVAFVSTYAPRQCGIATYTQNLRQSLHGLWPQSDWLSVAVTDGTEDGPIPPETRFSLSQHDADAYPRLARALREASVDLVCIQHEYGIFGGPSGAMLLSLLRRLDRPVVTTLHTVLASPSREQRQVLEELIRLSTRLVVMTRKAVSLLAEVHGVDPAKIDIVPHGIPDGPFIVPEAGRAALGLEDRPTLLTFGLLGPNKGIETMIEALPRIRERHPTLRYILLGATHPSLLRHEGERYRDSLQARAEAVGVQDALMMVNRFVTTEDLTRWLGAADIYVTPYLNEAQITSGTLAYAYGSGRAVVSTPYWHAAELLAGDRGRLVPFADPDAMAEAISGLLDDASLRQRMQVAAYAAGRSMTWTAVARRFSESFQAAKRDHAARERARHQALAAGQGLPAHPVLPLDHLIRLTGDQGLWQHAVFRIPAPEHGTCTDDNARGLILSVLLQEEAALANEPPHPMLDIIQTRCASFLQRALNRGNGRFRNFLLEDGRWGEEAGSEDSHARAIWALGLAQGHSRDPDLAAWAQGLFDDGFPATEHFGSPRSWAFVMLGCAEALARHPGDAALIKRRDDLALRLVDLYQRVADADWRWFETSATYDNARLPQALIRAGLDANHPEWLRIGMEAAEWLWQQQESPAGAFRPIGNQGFLVRGKGPAPLFDQQPLEAAAMVSLAQLAARASADPAAAAMWRDRAHRAEGWFHGENDLGLPVVDPITGACRDGLHDGRLNANAGAESTLAALMAGVENRLAATAEPRSTRKAG